MSSRVAVNSLSFGFREFVYNLARIFARIVFLRCIMACCQFHAGNFSIGT